MRSILGLAWLLGGCGGTSNSVGDATPGGDAAAGSGNVTIAASCPTPTCGGDPTGTWTFTTGCTERVAPAACPAATITGYGTLTGTVIISSNEFSWMTSLKRRIIVALPASCVASSCDATGMADGVPGYCADMAGTCTCTDNPGGDDSTSGGAATITGSTITAGTRTYDFCVAPDGKTLTMRMHAPSSDDVDVAVLTRP